MKFSVISPQSVIEHNVTWLEINTPAGNMVIQENHAPMLIEISPNSDLLCMQENGKQLLIVVLQGFLHVTRQQVKLLITKEA